MFGHDNQDNNQDDHQAAHGAHADDAQTVAPQTNNDDDTAAGNFVATPAQAAAAPHAGATDDLLDIKQEALQALTPLVGQLEQTPEEQFRTTMMMIQASDNHALVKVAYEAAKQISNEKERAQALLDIVNEINYFTQHTQV
ncbi:MAG TPA: hypothetical protein VF572_05580 [Candidatus Saccharimonadales bacterium]|jgi:hypothetical protein